MSRDASETADDGQSTGDVDAPLSACDELLQQNLDGQYFTACLPVATQLPFFLSVNQKVTRSPNGGPPLLDFSFTPLLVKATDTSQTVGDLVTLPPVPIHDDCTFDEVIGTLTLPKLANSLDRELVAEEAVLHGRFVSAERSCAGLFATVPLINLKLNGDHCVFIKLPPGSPVPTVSAQDYDCGPPAPAPESRARLARLVRGALARSCAGRGETKRTRTRRAAFSSRTGPLGENLTAGDSCKLHTLARPRGPDAIRLILFARFRPLPCRRSPRSDGSTGLCDARF